MNSNSQVPNSLFPLSSLSDKSVDPLKSPTSTLFPNFSDLGSSAPSLRTQKISSAQRSQEVSVKLEKAAKEMDVETLEAVLDQNDVVFQKKDLNRALIAVV